MSALLMSLIYKREISESGNKRESTGDCVSVVISALVLHKLPETSRRVRLGVVNVGLLSKIIWVNSQAATQTVRSHESRFSYEDKISLQVRCYSNCVES